MELYSRVALTVPFNGYAKGTEGYVVERLTDTHILVELFDAEGAYLAVEDVPVDRLDLSPERGGGKMEDGMTITKAKGRIEPFARVRLAQPFRHYPAGEEGAMVDEYPGTDDVMVEFVNDWENDLRVFTVPRALLELVTD